MYEELKQKVLDANMLLPKYGLVTFTWGNVSEIDRERGVIAIKPSGVAYDDLEARDIVIVDLEGNVVESSLKPSSDLMTHVELYKSFDKIGGVVHTHSRRAASWAQAGIDIPALGTTHADYFYGSVPCTRPMHKEEILYDYELNTGKVITETFETRKINPEYVPAALVYGHGPFVWGSDCFKAVETSVVLEEIACMAMYTCNIKGQNMESMQQQLLDRHFLRKHGPDAYYGQS